MLSIWIIGIISPCTNFNSLNNLYPFSKILYSNVCHQNISKSLIFNDLPLLVCARCTGIYFGSAFAAFVVLFINKNFNLKTKYLILCSIPMLVDVISISIKVYHYNKIISTSTGFLFGSAVFIYILAGIENLLFAEK